MYKLKLLFLFTMAFALLCFKTEPDETQIISWSNHCLNECYDPSAEAKLKKWELSVTDDLFMRLRKTYQNGKQEYYSFRLKNLDAVSFVPADISATGTLQIKAIADNIIFQTYNDPKGDIDDMAQEIDIPVRNMEPARLDSLKNALVRLKNQP